VTPDNHGLGMRNRANMNVGKWRRDRHGSHRTNEIIDRIAATPRSRTIAAILAALSGELTQRLSKHTAIPTA
jgi:hypothetical protein